VQINLTRELSGVQPDRHFPAHLIIITNQRKESRMRYFTISALALLACMIVALPASAGSRRYASDLIDDWADYAEEQGMEVFYTDVDRISEGRRASYSFDLEPGYYFFVAEGGEDIEDLDMYVYDEHGRDLDSDTLDDNYPICEFELDHYAEIEVEIEVYSFYGHEYEDYFAFVAASEVGRSDDDEYDVEDIREHWINWAEDSGYEVLYSDTGSLAHDRSEYFNFDLSAGNYYVYAESLLEGDDIDMYVYDQRAQEIASDTLTDNYPICSFELNGPGSVQIEVMPYTYQRGTSTDFAIVVAADGRGRILEGEQPDRINDQADRDYIEERRGEYMDMIAQMDLQNIYDEIDIVGEYNPRTVHITLGRGDYIVYAEAGLRIADLDLRVYDEDGYIVSEDTMTDNSPYCEFSVYESESFEIEIDPYEMEPGWDEGYYLLVVVRDER
jgi:hypothetical protein